MSSSLRLIFFIILLLLGLSYTAAAQPVITLPQTDTPPKLDGVLDDPCWQDLTEYTGFTDNTTGEPAKKDTFVKICRDAKNIYVAFRALDPRPENIRSFEKKRNGNWNNDDVVMVDIDSAFLGRNYSWFMVNAIGAQFDSIEGGSAQKIEWRGDWNAAAKIVEDGYNVEMAIPFSMLKYKKNQRNFGLCFERRFPEERAWACWPDMKGKYDLRDYANWENVNPPRIRPAPVFLSYVTSSTGGGGNGGSRFGLDVKYPFTSDKLGLLSVNPDFGTIEQGVDSVDFSYTERALGESRPFFNEWNLSTPHALFYSRRIEDFDVGVKLAAKEGSRSYQLLRASAGGEQNDTAFRFINAIGERSEVGFGLTDHNLPNHRNTVAYYSGLHGWKNGARVSQLSGYTFNSVATDQPGGRNRQIQFSTTGGNGSVGGQIKYAWVDETFQPELGLPPQTDVQGWSFGPSWSKVYRGRNLQSLGLSVNRERWDHRDGSPFIDGKALSASASFRGGRGVSFGLGESERDEFRDRTTSVGLDWNTDTTDRNGSVDYIVGRRAGGDYVYWSVAQKFRISEVLAVGFGHEWSRIGAPSEFAGTRQQDIVTLNYDLTSEKSVGGRMVRRLGKENLYFSYRQQVRRGMDAYVIYGDPNAEETTGMVSVKLVRPLF